MVDALGNAPSESEDNGFTVRSVSLTGYASIVKSLYKELPMFSIFGNIKRKSLYAVLSSGLYIILVTTLYKRTLVK